MTAAERRARIVELKAAKQMLDALWNNRSVQVLCEMVDAELKRLGAQEAGK